MGVAPAAMLSMAGPIQYVIPAKAGIHVSAIRGGRMDPGFRRDDSFDAAARAMKVSEFDFDLPQGLIADRPAAPRDAARLLVVDSGLEDRWVRDLRGLLCGRATCWWSTTPG